MSEPIMEVVPSVPETPTPSDPTPTPDTPAPESPAPETPEPAAETLYELPDGRKVNAETLQKEWKDNFYPDYTRKSQALKQIENINKPQEENVPAWKKDDYAPKSWAEVLELAKAETLADLEKRQQEDQQRQERVAQEVEAQLADIRKADAKLDESALFQHANKYGFRDLRLAHQNMLDLRNAEVNAEQRTLKNLKARGEDPISGNPGATAPDGGVDMGALSSFGSAQEFLRRIKGN